MKVAFSTFAALLPAFFLVTSCSSIDPSARSPDLAEEIPNKASLSIGGKDNAAATLNWDYSLDLETIKKTFHAQSPTNLQFTEWMLKRVVSWRVLDSQSGELLHSGENTHFFALADSSTYKRKGPLFNLWRSHAYSARGPVIDGIEQGPVLKRPRLRRGQKPTEEQQVAIEKIERAFSSKATKGFVSYSDSFLLFDKSTVGVTETNGFYNFPARTRSGPWVSADYPLGALVNLRRDYEDFAKNTHSTSAHATSLEALALPELVVNKLKVRWDTGEEVSGDDFDIQVEFNSY